MNTLYALVLVTASHVCDPGAAQVFVSAPWWQFWTKGHFEVEVPGSDPEPHNCTYERYEDEIGLFDSRDNCQIVAAMKPRGDFIGGHYKCSPRQVKDMSVSGF